MKKFEELFHVERIKMLAESQITKDSESFENENGDKCTYICDAVSGASGQYQLSEMAELIEMKFEENDYTEGCCGKVLDADCSYDVEQAYWNIADEFNKVSGLAGTFYFDYLEADNSWGLFYCIQN